MNSSLLRAAKFELYIRYLIFLELPWILEDLNNPRFVAARLQRPSNDALDITFAGKSLHETWLPSPEMTRFVMSSSSRVLSRKTRPVRAGPDFEIIVSCPRTKRQSSERRRYLEQYHGRLCSGWSPHGWWRSWQETIIILHMLIVRTVRLRICWRNIKALKNWLYTYRVREYYSCGGVIPWRKLNSSGRESTRTLIPDDHSQASILPHLSYNYMHAQQPNTLYT